jgi:dienelactone hydrolase
VVLLPDTGGEASAEAEARKLAQLGVASIIVEAPRSAPTRARAFDDMVTAVQLALAKLRKRPDVDPRRVGFIGEGVGAHVGAVALGREEGSVAAAVLADIGGVVVPSPKYAPERWLERASGTQLLFQRDSAARAMTQAEVKQLLLAAPPGTLMEQYDDLGAQAEAVRDSWMKLKLLAN